MASPEMLPDRLAQHEADLALATEADLRTAWLLCLFAIGDAASFLAAKQRGGNNPPPTYLRIAIELRSNGNALISSIQDQFTQRTR